MNREVYADFRELNQSLLTVIENERPDVLFVVVFTFEIWLETWKIIRDSGITATVNWATDDQLEIFAVVTIFHSLFACMYDYISAYL